MYRQNCEGHVERIKWKRNKKTKGDAEKAAALEIGSNNCLQLKNVPL